jgi:hypothetical protein
MEPFTPKKKGRPEEEIRKAIIDFLILRGWFCMITHGNLYQSGFPDVYACHSKYGTRWIEVKNPKKYSFTPAQLETFPKMCANGAGVWVLTEATEAEYSKLFKPANWYTYLSVFR